MITGNTRFIAHIGFPTYTFKSPMIYNPYFEANHIDVVVFPFASQAADYPIFLKSLFSTQNIVGALVTMPHKMTTIGLVDRLSTTAQIAGACNAVKKGADGKLEGDMFDGTGFVRSMQQKGVCPTGKSALIIGNGGVGSAIAASLAAEGIAELKLFDTCTENSQTLAKRLKQHYPHLNLSIDNKQANHVDIVVNATPLGMKEDDPMPIDPDEIHANMFVADVVLKAEQSAFLAIAHAKGCLTQNGTDMLFEQIPVYLEYFDLPSTTAENLRRLAKIGY